MKLRVNSDRTNAHVWLFLHIAGGAEDWPDHNYWAVRRRGPLSDGWHFIPWDQEISNDNTTRTGSRARRTRRRRSTDTTARSRP